MATLVREFVDDADALHALALPTGDGVEIWHLRPTERVVVLGSAQKPEAFDLARLGAAGVGLAGRRSGGGAVYIEPAGVVWIDVCAPRGSAWWHDDLAQNFVIVGQAWQNAFASLGVETELCTDSPDRSDAARMACWAGIGWGELTIDGVKVMGLSQRRTRWGARVQGMAVLDGTAERAADFLDIDEPTRIELRAAIGTATVDIAPAALASAVIAELREPKK